MSIAHLHADKRYTFNIKDTLLAQNPANGREQASISYEFDFKANVANDRPLTIRIPWSAFKATYRGREQDKAKPVATSSIRQFSVMMRRSVDDRPVDPKLLTRYSFFDTQHGPFSISLESISAYRVNDYDTKVGDKDPREIEAGRHGKSDPRRFLPSVRTPDPGSDESAIADDSL